MELSMKRNDLADQLGKEFWGILLFEWNLPALYDFLQLKSIAVGLNRFADWILFTDKLTFEEQSRFLEKLTKRKSDDPQYTDYSMNEKESHLHQLVCELLQIKYSGESLRSSTLLALYQVPPDVFYFLSIQMVERKWVSVQYVGHLYTQYKKIREGGLE